MRIFVTPPVRRLKSSELRRKNDISSTLEFAMEIQYYNLIPPLAQSEDFEPLSPGSDDSGVQEEQPQRPQRPPRSVDKEQILPVHSYINLVATGGGGSSIASSATPPLPKRQPYLVNPRSPSLSSRSTHFQRNSVRQMQKRSGTCKCKSPSVAGKTIIA